MKPKLNLLIAAGLAAASLVSSAQDAAKVETTPVASAEVMPISIEDAPLPDAIKTLARQAGLNINIDPKAFAGNPGPDGKVPPPPTVSFRWENLTAMQALQAVLDNNNLQLVPDPKTKVARITTKDPAALEPLLSKVIHLRFSNATNSIPVLQSVFSSARSKIIADVRTSHLVIIATEKELAQIEAIIKQIDVSPSQILIEAKFYETFKNPKTTKGIDWTDTLSAQRLKYGNVSQGFIKGLDPKAPTGVPGTPTYDPGFGGVVDKVIGKPGVIADNHSGFGGVGYLNADGLSVILSFLNSDGDSELIATPRAVALEGVDTDLSVVRNIPVFEQEQAPTTGSATPPATIKPNYKIEVNQTILNEVGTKLIVTPRIYGETNVFMSLKPEISSVEDKPASVTIDGKTTTSPIFSRRKLVTQSMVPSGSTLVLGGLNSDENANNTTKVPILGDVPGLGYLFRSEGKSRNKRNLMIFVTPTILGGVDYQNGEKSREFMKSKVEDKPDEDWSEWDSTKPHDWSKPVY